MSQERIILENFLYSAPFFDKVLPHLRPEFFENPAARQIIRLAQEHGVKYKRQPTPDALLVESAKLKISEQDHNEIKTTVSEMKEKTHVTDDLDWVVDMTEKFCKDRAMINAIFASISIIEGEDKKRTISDIQGLISEAQSITFDNRVGHSYFEDSDDQYSFYTEEIHRIPFDLEPFNFITKGGLTRKTLNVLMSSRTGGFKSGTMCHLAARWMLAGYSVLYITLEMSEQRIRERIDANLLNVPIDDLRGVKKEWYDQRLQALREKTPGSLIIKEYPTGTAHSGHFRFLLKELRQKKKFRPDIVFVDYLNLCASQTYSGKGDVNSYNKVKSITEEVRGLSIEFEFCAFSATQSGRQGVSAGDDLDVDDVSESYGLPMTVDLMIAIIDTEELASKGQLLFKQLKNRYADANIKRKFVLGVDKSRMLLFEVDESAAAGVRTFVAPSDRKDDRSKQAFDQWKM